MSWLGITLFSLVLAGLMTGGKCRAQEVSAGPGGVAVGGNIIDSQINIGIPAEKLPSLIEAATKDWRLLNEQQKQTINELQKTLGVNEDALKSFLQAIGERAVPVEQLGQKLREIARRYRELLAQVRPSPDDGPNAAEIKNAAAQALEAGQFDRADELLDQLQKLEDAALEATQLQRANTSAQRGLLRMAQLQYRNAARYFADAARHVPPEHTEVRLGYLDQEAGALYREGDERGDNEALAAAIESYGVVLTILSRESLPLAWAATQNNLGNALATLGVRETGTARLEKAMAAYSAALSECTRERAPLQWASTQLNLAAALVRLGERESGTARLEEAVAAYRGVLETVAAYYAAIEEDVYNRVPWIVWAMTQLNLGAALQTLGTREGNATRLEEAVAAYRAALEEERRDRVPLQWAMTQMNLGNALQALGEREGSTARLEEAVAAYRAALEESTRDRLPLQWALIQNNLGKALWVLGGRESGTGRLEEAVGAYRAALEVRTREKVPLDWAMTENNLGIALKTLGEGENGTARLEEAIRAYRAALEEYTPDRVPLAWAMTQMNLGNVLLVLGVREGGKARLEEAVVAYSASLERDPVPLDRANTQFNMGQALFKLDRHDQALSSFQEAEPVFRAVGAAQLVETCRRWIARLLGESEVVAPRTTGPATPASAH
jgi:tetratricopeptide (TPR) repeat protein